MNDVSPSDVNDVFAELEASLRQEKTDKQAAVLIENSIIKMLSVSKTASALFFSGLAMRLKRRQSRDVPTYCTDGESLFYNPDYAIQNDSENTKGILAHEAMHCALLHPVRMRHLQDREGVAFNRWLFNQAADLIVNHFLRKSGFSLPSGAVLPGCGAHKGVSELDAEQSSVEELYRRLKREDGRAGDPNGGGQDQGGGPGEVAPAKGTEVAVAAVESKWRVAVSAALNDCRDRGSLPANLERAFGLEHAPRVDWRQEMRDFFTRLLEDKVSWSSLDRRFVSSGLYLPGKSGVGLGRGCIWVDTSGSISGGVLASFSGCIQGIFQEFPECEVLVGYCDAAVQGEVEPWSASEGQFVLNPRGGGGTSHVPAFDWVRERLDAGEEIDFVVCLTDLHTVFPQLDPGVPVLWCVCGGNQMRPPFGRVLHVQEER